MDCCEKIAGEFNGEPEAAGPVEGIGRRRALKRLAGLASGIIFVSKGRAHGQGRQVMLAFCGQLLCVIPYEVARARGHFAEEGLDVRLVYTRGGNVAMQALVGRAVDYAGTSFDVALQAFANGAKIVRFASTGRLPLFALATAPKAAKEIRNLKDLENRTVGISALGNAEHILLIYLMKRAGADPDRVRFATLGTNLYEPLRLGQVDAGMVQEPALTLITGAGGGVIANVMDIAQANKYLGGAYEFMGVAVRVEERERRRDEMARLARALEKGLRDTRTIPVKDAVGALPKELITGANRDRLAGILERYRRSLYPDNVKIDLAATNRVADAHKAAGLLPPSVDYKPLLDLSVVEK
ncbi:MAG TPA: ABC transporter substrate-binding protein [Candidatus Binatia bacterium]|nr:ABC transporter substrate-binding protein [Candidatus Binatia bacterium]